MGEILAQHGSPMPQMFFGPAQEPFAVRSIHYSILDQQEQQGILTRCSSSAPTSIVGGHALYAGTNEQKREPFPMSGKALVSHKSSIRERLYLPETDFIEKGPTLFPFYKN